MSQIFRQKELANAPVVSAVDAFDEKCHWFITRTNLNFFIDALTGFAFAALVLISH